MARTDRIPKVFEPLETGNDYLGLKLAGVNPNNGKSRQWSMWEYSGRKTYLAKKESEILSLIHGKRGAPVGKKEITSMLYDDREDGGPLNPEDVLRHLMVRINNVLNTITRGKLYIGVETQGAGYRLMTTDTPAVK
jgi:hypothetical protein